MLNRWIVFVRVIISDFFSNNCPYMAAGIAYWTLFSAFPLSLAAVSLLGFANPTSIEQEEMVARIIEQIPVSGDYVLDLVERVAEARGALSFVAVLGLLVSGSAVFAAIRKGINHAWHVTRPHPFFIGRGIDLLMLVFVGLLALIAGTNLVGLVARGASSIWFVGEPVVSVGFDLGLLAASFIVLAILYRFVPYTEVEWRDVWLGALVGSLMAYVVRVAFSGFLINVNEFNLIYGSLGGADGPAGVGLPLRDVPGVGRGGLLHLQPCLWLPKGDELLHRTPSALRPEPQPNQPTWLRRPSWQLDNPLPPQTAVAVRIGRILKSAYLTNRRSIIVELLQRYLPSVRPNWTVQL